MRGFPQDLRLEVLDCSCGSTYLPQKTLSPWLVATMSTTEAPLAPCHALAVIPHYRVVLPIILPRKHHATVRTEMQEGGDRSLLIDRVRIALF